jgi:hypothetical protein
LIEREPALATGQAVRGPTYVEALVSADLAEREVAKVRATADAEERFARAWHATRVFQEVRDHEEARQRMFKAGIREIEDRGLFERVGQGWPAATGVLATATAVGSLADFRGWSGPAKAVYAVGALGVGVFAAEAVGREKGRKEIGRTREQMLDSRRAVRRARNDAGLLVRLGGGERPAVDGMGFRWSLVRIQSPRDARAHPGGASSATSWTAQSPNTLSTEPARSAPARCPRSCPYSGARVRLDSSPPQQVEGEPHASS